MSVARNSIKKVPTYTYTFKNYFGSGLHGNLYGAAASPTVAIAIGVATASSGASTTNRGVIYYTTDGNVWSSVSTTTFGNNSIIGCAYGANTFVAVGQGNTIATSPGTSGSTWTSRTSPFTGGNMTYITFQNGYFIIYNDGVSRLAYSTDGITWTLGISGQTVIYGYDVTNKGGIFYISNNPSSSRWIQVNGYQYHTTATTDYHVFSDITTTGTRTDVTIGTHASLFPQYFPDGRLLIIANEHSATTDSGFHSLLATSRDGTKVGFPTGENAGSPWWNQFFPYVQPDTDDQIALSVAPAAVTMAAKYTVANAAAPATGLKRAYYVYNDGYYNCVFAGGSSTNTPPWYGPLINAGFNPETMEFVKRPQVLGTGWAQQGGYAKLGSFRYGMTYAFDITFKGKNYIFSGGSNNVEGSTYLVGIPTYVRV